MAGDSARGPELPPPLITIEADGNETVTEGVLLAVSAVSDRPPTDLPLLNNVIDADALDALFAHAVNSVRLTYFIRRHSRDGR